jgi:1-acyl-sn-glycerol-3-phosphate acyltransferase
VYGLIAGITGIAADAFYRRVSLGGAVPEAGPILLVANHPNGLIDPVVVANAAARKVRMLAKAPLFEMPGLSVLVRGMGALPVYRAKDGADTSQNAKTFAAVSQALVEEDAVLIFPEGISHDEPQLQKLKTGAARMALQACEAGAADLAIVPIGLVYRDKERFRSEVATLIGNPVRVAQYLERGKADDAEVVRALTEDIAAALASVTINLEQWEDLPLLEAVDAIWRIDDPQRTSRIKQLADGVALLRENFPARLDAARERVVEWKKRLDALGLEPRDLSPEHVAARTDASKAAAFAMRNLLVALVGLPIATFGAIFFAVPFWLGHFIFLALKPERDTAATVKLLTALVLFPLWQVAATVAMWLWIDPSVALVVAGVSPFMGMTTRWFFRGRKRALRDAGAFFALMGRKSLDARLTSERDALVNEIDELGKLVEEVRTKATPAVST